MSQRIRVAPGCAITIRGTEYAEGTEVFSRLLERLVVPIPELELRLEGMSEAEYVEIKSRPGGRYAIRAVSAADYATEGRAASFSVDARGELKPKFAERPPSDGKAEFERRLQLPDDAEGRVRRNPCFREQES